MEAELLRQGPLGVATVALAWVVLRLYRENSKLHDRLLEEREKRIAATQEAIIAVRASSAEVKELAGTLTSTLRSLLPRRSSGTE